MGTLWDGMTNLVFQDTSTCYYTYLPNCSGEKVRVSNLDDGMRAVLPAVVQWPMPTSSIAVSYVQALTCSDGQLWLDEFPHALQTSTLTLVYSDALTVLNGTETMVLPAVNTSMVGCKVAVASGYYDGLQLMASTLEVHNASIMAMGLTAPTITVTGSYLEDVQMTASTIYVAGSKVRGTVDADIVKLTSSLVNGKDKTGRPAVLIRIAH